MKKVVVVLACLALGVMAVVVGHVPGASAASKRSMHAAQSNSGCHQPGSQPNFIAILVQGIASYVLANGNSTTGTATFNPAQVTYCATDGNTQFAQDGYLPPDNGNTVLRSMADGWLNYSYNSVKNEKGLGPIGSFTHDQSTVKPGNGANLINKLAQAGGYVLPFSYSGNTYMSGSAANPVFHFTAYDASTVANTNPQYDEPPKLNAELMSIHKVFPNVPIVIIGHSNGGLIAEQWWLRYGTMSCGGTCGEHGVTHIYTLDSPINGVADAGACSLPAIGAACSRFLKVGSPTARAYNDLWNGATSNPPDPTDGSPHIEWEDWRNGGMFTAVGTYGDPLYDSLDEHIQLVPGRGAPIETPDAQPGAGILSQVMLSNSCLQAQQSANLFGSECKPEHYVFISPCDGLYGTPQPSSPKSPADGTHRHWPYGFPGNVYIHSMAKDCPGTIAMIMKLVWTLHPTVVPTTPAAPSAAALAAWEATAGDPPNTVGAALSGVASLLPSSDATQIAELRQLAGIPLADIGEDPPAQAAEAHADIAALDQFFHTPGLTPAEGAPTTTPTTPAGPPPAALEAWKATAGVPAVTLGAALRRVASLLPASDSSEVAELQQLASFPPTGDTPAQMAEAQKDVSDLDSFFNTPGFTPGG